MAGSYNNSKILVVHCVDTEGPIGGDVRKNADGSKEFYDNWKDIKDSLSKITSDNFRHKNCDSLNNLFFLNWFIMDFTGFNTNPKNRIQEYHNTYDNIKSLNTSLDSFHWHYHQPPKKGIGDQWSDDWESSKEHYNILGRRILERNDFPEAFRAGGTIEDNKCSLWLEDHLMIDYSNRVSDRSYKTENIFDFNWYGAPKAWGSYHPSKDNFLEKGSMRRFITRCVDAKSRLHTISQEDINSAFEQSISENGPTILSYFSHDHRDMIKETEDSIRMIKNASEKYNVPFHWCDALQAVQITNQIKPESVLINFERILDKKVRVSFNRLIYQKNPFIFLKKSNGDIKFVHKELEYIPNCPFYIVYCDLDLEEEDVELGVACTSLSGNKSVLTKLISGIKKR